MVNRRLTQELEGRKLLSISQHAFRCGLGTETYFVQLEELLAKVKSDKHHADCAIIVLAKAFNRTWKYAIMRQLAR